MIDVNKNLAAFGALLFFTFGVIAVSFAAPDPYPEWSVPTIEFQRGVRDHVPQSDSDTLTLGVVFKVRLETNPTQKVAQHAQATCSDFQEPPIIVALTRACPCKVSLQILHSVLIL